MGYVQVQKYLRHPIQPSSVEYSLIGMNILGFTRWADIGLAVPPLALVWPQSSHDLLIFEGLEQVISQP